MSRLRLKFSLTDKDLGMKFLIEQAKKLEKKPKVKVGVQGESGLAPKKKRVGQKGLDASASLTVVDVATFHEFGTSRVPERSFIRSTVDENQTAIFLMKQELLKKIMNASAKLTVEKALALLGEAIQKMIQAKFTNNDWAPLADSTIRRKNRWVIQKAVSTINKLSAKSETQGFRAAQKAVGIGPVNKGFAAKLSEKDKNKLNAAGQTVMTGGKSNPLIDTGQLRRSIRYKVDNGRGGNN